jgi:hypothetical protein
MTGLGANSKRGFLPIWRFLSSTRGRARTGIDARFRQLWSDSPRLPRTI